MRLLRLVKYSGNFLVAAQKVILILASLALSGVMVTEVVSRYFLGYPIWGWEELAMISAMWLYMIGAAMAAYERSHLKVEIVPLLFKDPRKASIVDAAAILITLIIAGFVTYWSSSLLFWGLERGQTTPVFYIPWVVSQCSLFFASILMTVYFARDLVERIRNILRSGEPSSRRPE
jgi:TRAP-type C4-dicarboxylate transport system permease small subunit